MRSCETPAILVGVSRRLVTSLPEPLRPGDGVLVSIDGDLSLDFYAAALHRIQALHLVPYVFRGVPAPEGATVSNTYIEARNDLYDHCRVLVVVAGSASAERNFGITELPRAVSEGLIGILYRVAPHARPDPIISGITARTIATPEEFALKLDEDLRALLTPR